MNNKEIIKEALEKDAVTRKGLALFFKVLFKMIKKMFKGSKNA